MKVLVTGANGMLGSEIVKQIKEKTDWEVLVTDVAELDITKSKSIEKYFEKNKPNVLINCAAYTDVNGCEENWELCKLLNADAVGYLAKECKKNNTLFVHISTDYVFSEDKKDGYDEDHLPYTPVNKYGASKALGEKEVLDNTDKYYLIRTQWLYGAGARNFIAKIIELADKMSELKVVTDEVGAPTYVKDLAERIGWMIQNKIEPGIYHVTAAGSATRNEFATEILRLAKKDTKVLPTTHKEYGRGTKVPAISILNNTKLQPMRNWKDALKDFMEHNSF